MNAINKTTQNKPAPKKKYSSVANVWSRFFGEAAAGVGVVVVADATHGAKPMSHAVATAHAAPVQTRARQDGRPDMARGCRCNLTIEG